MALHDYYQDRYAIALSKSRNSDAAANGMDELVNANGLTVTVTTEAELFSPIERTPSPDPDEFIPVCSDQSVLDDKDYLQYLTMPYLASVAEAFDDDGSGFIRISEANEFTSGIPEGWTLLQWIAYWARGWVSESASYSLLISTIGSGMRSRLEETLAENAGMVFGYLKAEWTETIKGLTWCANTKSSPRTDSPLDDLVRAHMGLSEERIEASLERFFFTLDSPEALALVCETTRIEKVPKLHFQSNT